MFLSYLLYNPRTDVMINLFRHFRTGLGTKDIQNWFKNITTDTTFNRVLQKISIIKAENGSCVAEMKIEKEHVNSKGGLHGGLTATIVDVLTSCALLTRDSRPNISVDIHVSYLKEALNGNEILINAETIKCGKTLGFTECVISDKATGSIIAKGKQTLYILH
ncbi:hypothetical protein RI129_001028 [Pyrocoelia pectoralis]|uniref:Thioesterase domain-containing protein n=1 Tax=Pyrocoelia pectoralis TaxID=417401 RepID=A0AAN7VWV8_9COLE